MQVITYSCAITMYIMVMHKITLKDRCHQMITKQTFKYKDK